MSDDFGKVCNNLCGLYYTFCTDVYRCLMFTLQAGKCKEPCEVYKHMHGKEIGRQSALFYKAWALATEELGQNKMADKIFMQGIDAGAQPLSDLKKARE